MVGRGYFVHRTHYNCLPWACYMPSLDNLWMAVDIVRQSLSSTPPVELYENLGQVGASIKQHLVDGMRNMWHQLNEIARSHTSQSTDQPDTPQGTCNRCTVLTMVFRVGAHDCSSHPMSVRLSVCLSLSIHLQMYLSIYVSVYIN